MHLFHAQIAVCEEKDVRTERAIARAANKASHFKFDLTLYNRIMEIREAMEEVSSCFLCVDHLVL